MQSYFIFDVHCSISIPEKPPTWKALISLVSKFWCHNLIYYKYKVAWAKTNENNYFIYYFFCCCGAREHFGGASKKFNHWPNQASRRKKKNVAFSPGRTGTESLFCSVELWGVWLKGHWDLGMFSLIVWVKVHREHTGRSGLLVQQLPERLCFICTLYAFLRHPCLLSQHDAGKGLTHVCRPP